MSAHETSERAENASVPICPHCGFNLAADRPVERDGWVIYPWGGLSYRGKALRTRASWAGILHALAATPGKMTVDALLNRVSDSENPNTLHSQISQMKRWLAQRDLPFPVEGFRVDGGYRWRTAA
jgi:hypothetical protein